MPVIFISAFYCALSQEGAIYIISRKQTLTVESSFGKKNLRQNLVFLLFDVKTARFFFYFYSI